jgi:hypothetical protein
MLEYINWVTVISGLTIYSAVLIGLAVFIFKTMTEQRLVKALEHDYANVLLKLKEDLQLKNQNSLEETKAKLIKQNQKELDNLKIKLGAEYDIIKAKSFRYSERQFELYNEVWVALCDLEASVKNLWKQANIENLKDLQKQLKESRTKLRHGGLIIDHKHYIELDLAIEEFEAFKFGKDLLTAIRDQKEQNKKLIIENEIKKAIGKNEIIKNKLLDHLHQIQTELRRQISGSVNLTQPPQHENKSKKDLIDSPYFTDDEFKIL